MALPDSVASVAAAYGGLRTGDLTARTARLHEIELAMASSPAASRAEVARLTPLVAEERAEISAARPGGVRAALPAPPGAVAGAGAAAGADPPPAQATVPATTASPTLTAGPHPATTASPTPNAGPHPAMTADGIRVVEDIDRMDPRDIAVMQPRQLYRILHTVLCQSWHRAKEVLLARDAPNANRKALMAQLIDYRDWHYNVLLREVQRVLTAEGAPEGLTKWSSAGSKSLTSDVDVNLKGTETERAVKYFNLLFKNPAAAGPLAGHTWDHEPGVVYDVNAYAVDFMHNFGGVKVGPLNVTVKEGAHSARATGGIAGADMAESDRGNQLVTALFKARLFMTADEFRTYEAATLRGLPTTAMAGQFRAFRAAETSFANYMGQMARVMGATHLGDATGSGVAQLKAGAATRVAGSGHDPAVEAKRENVLMEAANRIYEYRLLIIRAKRAELERSIAKIETLKATRTPALHALWQDKIDEQLLELRRLISEAAMYANEASMTDATVHHVVVGIQGGAGIDQQKWEIMNSVHENLADVMKEAGRYGKVSEPDDQLGMAAFKAGKYIMRLADAGKNLGFGYIWGVQVLYELGYVLSGKIKAEADAEPPIDPEVASRSAVERIAGYSRLAQLLDLAAQTATQITAEYFQEREAGGGDTQTAYGHRTGPSKSFNTLVLNKDMVHPRNRGPGKISEMESAERAGQLEDFSFRLSKEEFERLYPPKLKSPATKA